MYEKVQIIALARLWIKKQRVTVSSTRMLL